MNDFALMITANPDVHAGAKDVGHYGVGLNISDQPYPSGAGRPRILVIRDTDRCSVYRLQYSDTFINEGRTIQLNFQLYLPKNTTLTDYAGNIVDPLTVLDALYAKYSERYIAESGTSRRFAMGGTMSGAEMDSFARQYRLVQSDRPNRPMSNNMSAPTGIVVLPEQQWHNLLGDHAYPEFQTFKEVILTTQGSPSAALAQLKVPRQPQYSVFVNGQNTGMSMSAASAPITHLVRATTPDKKDTEATLRFGAQDSLDPVKEILYFTVPLDDKVSKITVRLRFDGLSGSSVDKSEIESCLVLSSNGRAINGQLSGKELVFKLKGKETLMSWRPKVISTCGKYTYIPYNQDTVQGIFEYAVSKNSGSGGSVKAVSGDAQSEMTTIVIDLDGSHGYDSLDGDVVLMLKRDFKVDVEGARFVPVKTSQASQTEKPAKGKAKADKDKAAGNVMRTRISVPKAIAQQISVVKVTTDVTSYKPAVCQKQPEILDGAPVFKGRLEKRDFWDSLMANRATAPVLYVLCALALFLLGYALRPALDQWMADEPQQTVSQQSQPAAKPATSAAPADSSTNKDKGNDQNANPKNSGEPQELQTQADAYNEKIRNATLTFDELNQLDVWLSTNSAPEVKDPINGYETLDKSLPFLKLLRQAVLQLYDGNITPADILTLNNATNDLKKRGNLSGIYDKFQNYCDADQAKAKTKAEKLIKDNPGLKSFNVK